MELFYENNRWSILPDYVQAQFKVYVSVPTPISFT